MKKKNKKNSTKSPFVLDSRHPESRRMATKLEAMVLPTCLFMYKFSPGSTRNSHPKGHLCSAVSQEGFNSRITGKLETRVGLFWGNSKYKCGYSFFFSIGRLLFVLSQTWPSFNTSRLYSDFSNTQGESFVSLGVFLKTSQATWNLRWSRSQQQQNNWTAERN